LQERKPSRLEYRKEVSILEGSKLFLLSVFISQLSAQELVTDRPDQTESAVTVPLNSLQIETGFVYESLKEDNIDIKNYSIAGTLIRYGLEDNVEFRLGIGYLIHKGEETTVNFDDVLAGLKINFLQEEPGPMDLGLLAHIVVPVFPIFSFQLIEPELILAASKSISDRFSISANFGDSYDSQWTEIIYLYTSALGYSLSDKVGAFIEVYGNFPSTFSPEHLYDGGITYLLSDNIRVDLSGGRKFSENDSFWF
jgi:hypothetical protein